MAKIGIYFGTDTGRTRRIAKLIAQKLGDVAEPGLSVGLAQASWEEFLPRLAGHDMTGKKVALFGLGDQEKYSNEFVDAMIFLHDAVLACGATLIGTWPVDGYSFKASQALIDGRFVGLALDPINQAALSEVRVDAWLQQLKSEGI